MTRGRRITRAIAVSVAMALFFATLIAFFVLPFFSDRRMRKELGNPDAYVTDTARSPWLYVDENGNARIKAEKCFGMEEIVIPDVINGVIVTRYDSEFTPIPWWIKRITFPSTLRSIEDFPFHKWTDIEEIVFQEGIEDLSTFYLGARQNLKKLVLPATVKSLRADVLKGANAELVVHFGGTEEEWLAIGKAAVRISEEFTVVFESNG